MPKLDLRPLHHLLIVLALAIGLAADVRTDIVGQMVLSAAIWLLLFCLLARIRSEQRYILMACLTIATIGELVLSLAWGLYTYRLGNIPLFVPPGHVLLLMLGLALARRISDRGAFVVTGCAGIYAAIAAASGLDTFAVPLFLVIAVAWFALPAHRRLYAGTFVVSLGLELYGTWLGNWSWAAQVPGMPLVTTNPPGTVGAFYCALDALVVGTMLLITPRLRGRTI
jgi:hypothetical protein